MEQAVETFQWLEYIDFSRDFLPLHQLHKILILRVSL
jgi:hypothetical protein